ncbi:hypothetical protein [Chloroflexus sp.]|uniref:hypothetical protein n=1 Tax=Chloroflexus sp. TaxID=1904827 RepID=UPI002ADE813D|nr:hypothetical protein [Chloroflexus sp.]
MLIVLPALALTSSSGPYNLSWWTVDGGGYTVSTGGSYSLGGTVEQTDAGVLSGGSYTLRGGFWGGAEVTYQIWAPLIVRDSL